MYNSKYIKYVFLVLQYEIWYEFSWGYYVKISIFYVYDVDLLSDTLAVYTYMHFYTIGKTSCLY